MISVGQKSRSGLDVSSTSLSEGYKVLYILIGHGCGLIWIQVGFISMLTHMVVGRI